MYELSQAGFVAGDRSCTRVLRLPSGTVAQEWQRRQDASLDEYRAAIDRPPEGIRALYRLFDRYIAAALAGRARQRILDVGCGMSRRWPEYVETLRRTRDATGHVYVGLDPIEHEIDRREYPFICGRLEDVRTVLSDKVDVFLFATSLDHFDDLEGVRDAMRDLAAPGALCIAWVGLHDSRLIAGQTGARAFERLFRTLSVPGFLLRSVRTLASLPVYFGRLRLRERRLRLGEPLDRLHFHYFTETSLRATLQRLGRIADTVFVPGTNCVFMTVEIGAPAGGPVAGT